MMPSDFEILSALFSYEPETGLIRWRVHKGKGHPGVVAGFPGGLPGENGGRYVYVRVDGRNYSGHRIAWLLMTGSFPEKGFEVDHINGRINDNRWENLRIVSRKQNMQNRKTHRNNECGIRGVGFVKHYGKWQARIMVDRKAIHLGYFDVMEDAAAARKSAEELYFGEFARKAA